MGTILWQINDCWPVISWAVIDGDGRLKPAWYALRRAYADRLLTIQPGADGELSLVAVNETQTPWVERVEVTRRSVDGASLAAMVVEIAVPPSDAQRVVLPAAVALAGDQRAELIIAGRGAGRAVWFFVEDIDLGCPAPAYLAKAEAVEGGYRVEVTATTLLRDLVLYPDRLDPAAEVDDALVTLLPGESATLTIRTSVRVDPAAFTEPPVLRCSGQLRTGAVEPPV